ncbi:MAG: histidine phosphatase family protein [Rhodobacteraceae bacterium]|nr:histidine phosphatase family protein [Paracoccaceae bacterium]
MKRLILLRHAKSSWDDASQTDHERPLNQRGRLATALMGAWFREQPWRIDTAIVSTSLRTRQTWDLLTRQWDAAPPVRFEASIYEAESAALLAAIRVTPGAAQTLLMVGHNPGMETLTALLTAQGSRRISRFPTAAAAVLEAEDISDTEEWTVAGQGRFKVVEFEQPKTLV